MSKNIYSLLVGIDTYHPQSNPFVSSLKGCVNDINAMEAYLQERIAKDKNSRFQLVEPLKLANEKATRTAIIDGFKNYLSQADSEDVVLFYYSGHGANEPAAKEFWQEEPDHLNETLVCYDSRTSNSRDLADKELRYLISKVAKNNPHILVILDCCHSGSGTRDIPAGSRLAPEEKRFRPWDSFVFAEELLGSRGSSEKVDIPQGKHILLAACRDYQEAKEYKIETGEYRGIFSYFLLQTLQHDSGSLNYRDLVRNINGIVSGKINNQSPQVEAILADELLEQSFLGGAVPQRPPHFTLSYNKDRKSWVINGGALHGIPQSSGGEETVLTILAPGSDREELSNLDGAFARGRVTQVLPQLSLVKVEVGEDSLNEDFSYDAVVVSLPVEKLKVCIKGEEEGVQLAVAQLQTAFAGEQPSLYVEQVEPEESADYYLEAKEGQYWIKLAMESDRPQVAPIPKNLDEAGYTEERAEVAIQRLEHIARWKNTLELKSPAASRIKSGDIELEIVKVAADGSQISATAAEITLKYDRHYDSWEKPRFFLRLTNKSNKTLYCNVLNLTQSYAVGLPFFTSQSSICLEGGQAIDGNRLRASIPDELWEQGVGELQDRLKLIVSTGEFDASLLEQDKLEVMASKRDLPPLPSDPRLQNGLNRLLVRQQHKDVEPDTEALASDWLTKEVIFTIIRPQGALDVSSQRSISLGYGVEVLPHPTLEAKASLTTAEETARSIGAVLPSILREQPGVVEPVRFSSNSRGVNGELSALELFDVVDYQAVTPEAPLRVRLEAELKSGEHLLAVGFDGEFFLPLGRLAGTGDDTEICLERLPQPTSSGRSLHGSIRIFFQKVISQELGLPFDSYPVLAVATADAGGKVIYEKNPEIVAAKVAAAEKILLYVHGIIGDTKMMAGSGQRVMLEYDLVLTFDYENLNTTIEENARLLGEKLKAAGLAANHEKHLDVVAHSMGGLVCRWFIEKEGGHRVVRRLVMAGTPNGGTPWATIQDWALASLGFALNQVSSVFWPAQMVAKLLEFVEEKERSLEQMKPSSDLLRELGQACGSSVPYTIIAGDRSLVPEAVESDVLERLADRLFAKTLDLAFFGQANDLAVTVASMKAVEKEGVSVDNVACDHFSYFTSEAGLKALAKALDKVGEVKLPVKDNKKKWLIGGVVLAVLVAIACSIGWKVYHQQQEQPPEESVSWQRIL